MNPDYQLFSLIWLAVFKPRTEYKACTAFKILWPLSHHYTQYPECHGILEDMKKCNLIIKLYQLKAHQNSMPTDRGMLVEQIGKLSDHRDVDHTRQTSTKRLHVNAASVVELFGCSNNTWEVTNSTIRKHNCLCVNDCEHRSPSSTTTYFVCSDQNGANAPTCICWKMILL